MKYIKVCTQLRMYEYATTGQVRTGMYEYVLDPIFKGNQNYNTFGSEDKYLLAQMVRYIVVCTITYKYVLVRTSIYYDANCTYQYVPGPTCMY